MNSDNTFLHDGLGALDRAQGMRIAIIGDCMIDRFINGQVDRISPEAPVPVVHIREESDRLGGAANVAANVSSLGGHATLYAACGDGETADQLQQLLRQRGISTDGLLRCADRETTVKNRILASGQQIVRIDRETVGSLGSENKGRFHASLDDATPFAAAIVSDYGKGMVDRALMDVLRTWREDGIVVVVDPKQGNFDLYRGVTAITPNQKEAANACHDTVETDEDAERVGHALRDRLENDMILLTRGPAGMSLLDENNVIHHLPTEARQVFDVTGAGDTVIAAFTLLMAAGAPAPLAARMANVAAGLAVRQLGTATITADELRDAWRQRQGDHA